MSYVRQECFDMHVDALLRHLDISVRYDAPMHAYTEQCVAHLRAVYHGARLHSKSPMTLVSFQGAVVSQISAVRCLSRLRITAFLEMQRSSASHFGSLWSDRQFNGAESDTLSAALVSNVAAAANHHENRRAATASGNNSATTTTSSHSANSQSRLAHIGADSSEESTRSSDSRANRADTQSAPASLESSSAVTTTTATPAVAAPTHKKKAAVPCTERAMPLFIADDLRIREPNEQVRVSARECRLPIDLFQSGVQGANSVEQEYIDWSSALIPRSSEWPLRNSSSGAACAFYCNTEPSRVFGDSADSTATDANQRTIMAFYEAISPVVPRRSGAARLALREALSRLDTKHRYAAAQQDIRSDVQLIAVLLCVVATARIAVTHYHCFGANGGRKCASQLLYARLRNLCHAVSRIWALLCAERLYVTLLADAHTSAQMRHRDSDARPSHSALAWNVAEFVRKVREFRAKPVFCQALCCSLFDEISLVSDLALADGSISSSRHTQIRLSIAATEKTLQNVLRLGTCLRSMIAAPTNASVAEFERVGASLMQLGCVQILTQTLWLSPHALIGPA